jgi:hypothetical protein
MSGIVSNLPWHCWRVEQVERLSEYPSESSDTDTELDQGAFPIHGTR